MRAPLAYPDAGSVALAYRGQFQLLALEEEGIPACQLRGMNPTIQNVQREEKDWLKNFVEKFPSNQQSDHGVTAGVPYPVQVAVRGAFRHGQHDDSAAVHRG